MNRLQFRPSILLVHRYPAFWLLVASVVTALFMSQGGFSPIERPDTNSYEHLSLPSHQAQDADLEGKWVRLALGSSRTLFYPLFLHVVGPFTPDYALIPWIHWILFSLAMLYFWYAVSLFSGSRWFALAVAAPLAWPCGLSYFAWVMPDSMALVFSLVAVASVFLLARRPSSPAAWIGLTAATFLAYQTKPVTQFLVVLLPLLALLLRLSIEPRTVRSLGHWLMRVALATALPLLLFCTVRFVVVGQFSVVAFNGYNLIGIAANLIDEDVVASLPEEHRVLAGRILQARRAQGRQPYSERPSLRVWRRNYVSDQWKITEGVARRVIAEEIAAGNDAEAALRPFNLVMERRLAALASLVLRDHPREYIEWVTSGFLHGVYRVVLCLPLRALLLVVMSSLPLVLAIRILRRGGDPPAAEPGEGGGHAAGLAGITLVATSFCLACLGLISLVSWPLPRYLVLANLLLPSALGGALFVLWANTLRGIELRRSR